MQKVHRSYASCIAYLLWGQCRSQFETHMSKRLTSALASALSPRAPSSLSRFRFPPAFPSVPVVSISYRKEDDKRNNKLQPRVNHLLSWKRLRGDLSSSMFSRSNRSEVSQTHPHYPVSSIRSIRHHSNVRSTLADTHTSNTWN